MNAEKERSRSLWMEHPMDQDGPQLVGDSATEVLVIGSGIAGLSCAYELVCSGHQVAVVDRGRIGRGMTARTSAHLAFELDDFFEELRSLRGEDVCRQYYESQSAAVDRIEDICRQEAINCDFARVDGYFVPVEEKDIDYLRKELDAARAAGFTDAEWVENGPGPWRSNPAVRFPRQGRFHPLKYLDALAEALRRRGATLCAESPIVGLDEKDGQVRAKTGTGGIITAAHVVVATNSPFHLRIPIHTKQAPYRTYVIVGPIPKGAAPDALIWDTLEPSYHYVRIHPGRDEDMLIVGGEDHKAGEADDMDERLYRLEVWARERFPELGPISHKWSGQVFEPSDYVPFIGKSPGYERVYLVTGDSGEGLTAGVAGALLIRHLIDQGASPWSDVYDPDRLMMRGAIEFAKENLHAAKHWAAHLGGGEVRSVDDIPPGEGALVRIDGKMTAAFRTDEGDLKLCSASCTHMGCVVRWNPFEQCWDCPCHGSHFSADGEPLQGPAFEPLSKL
ncbi:FAD-dependent oxidoreductase [Mesorhizobium sp. WSM2239]|uniref:FAD-dependent oxidoreductase n=2 Tax=unclassified Mesorhizobium TaxID=325217 RepID=A0AAU8D571_9HYPH